MNATTMDAVYTPSGRLDRERCVNQYAPLVKRIAHYMMAKLPASVELDDVIQAGMLGLLDAATRYEEAQGAQFETYAAQRIRGSILDSLRQVDWLPRALRRDLRRIEAAVRNLEHQFGRAPGEREIAAELGMSLSEYQKMLQEARGYQLLSYEDLGEPEDDFFEHYEEGSSPTPLEELLDDELRARIVDAIGDLPEREQTLMGLYYEQELNFREIGEVLGVGESRVCQLHSQAMARLRSRLKGR